MFQGMTTRQQGDAGLGKAIAYFATKGQQVSVPLTDNSPYDLVADVDGELKRVQVKTSSRRSRKGDYEVQIKSVRPNRSGNSIRNFNNKECDLLYILCSDGSEYVIPTQEVTAGTMITLTEKWQDYKDG